MDDTKPKCWGEMPRKSIFFKRIQELKMDANRDEVLNHTHNLIIDYVKKLEAKVTDQQNLIKILQDEIAYYQNALEREL